MQKPIINGNYKIKFKKYSNNPESEERQSNKNNKGNKWKTIIISPKLNHIDNYVKY